jgi:hypothetical protein
MPSPVYFEISNASNMLGPGFKSRSTSSTVPQPRVRLTVGNRPVYRGNRPYWPGPVTVLAGYQPLGLGKFEFEFQN